MVGARRLRVGFVMTTDRRTLPAQGGRASADRQTTPCQDSKPRADYFTKSGLRGEREAGGETEGRLRLSNRPKAGRLRSVRGLRSLSMKCAVSLDADCCLWPSERRCNRWRDPRPSKPHGAAQAATKDERKATQLAECMQLLAEYFCCCAALRRGRRSRLDNKPRRQAQVCWLQDSGRRLTRRVCLNRAATDRASVRAAGERWRQSDVEQHGAMNRHCATAGRTKLRALSPR